MYKPLQYITPFILCLFWHFQSNAQITLSHNVGNIPIETNMFSCEEDEGWSRIFTLADFGIAPNEQFKIKSGQVAFTQSNDGAFLQFSVYSIAPDFPTFFYSLYPRTLLGTRGIGQAPIISGAPEIVSVDFEEPIIVPAGTDRILVTVSKVEDFYNPASAQIFIAGTEEDTGESWYEGCDENYNLTQTTDLVNPVPDANFYINVTGDTFDIQSTGEVTRLSHNCCDDIVETDIHSCSSSYIYWARSFTLEDFGISTDEEFVINSGQVGINEAGWLAEISFNIYEIDDNFPASFSEANLIGSSQYQELSSLISENSQIVEITFDTPITVPAGVERILVEVHKGIVYGSAVAFISGTTQNNDVSWQRGCTNTGGGPTGDTQYVTTASFGRPDANFYINVTGDVIDAANSFSINVTNGCTGLLREFSIGNIANISSVIWNFDDPTSGLNNNSIDIAPTHNFSANGTYDVVATVTSIDGTIVIINESVDVEELPIAYEIDTVYACEDNYNTGFSSSIDVSTVTTQVLGGQTNKVVTFFDAIGNEYNTLANPYTNSIANTQTLTVRVANEDDLFCFSETSFDIIINTLPEVIAINGINLCDDNDDGFIQFNLSTIPIDLINGQSDITVELIDSNASTISPANYSNFLNLTVNQDYVTAILTNYITNCSSETTVNLVVDSKPIANVVENLLGCDDNNDGISEYFDTSNIENQLLNSQTGLSINYFDENGNALSNPLPNPYTNTSPFTQDITARVTNTTTNCYAETTFQLQTVTQPNINQPNNLYACDLGNGFSEFDTSTIEQQIIGNQSGLLVSYYDSNSNQLLSPLPISFQNSESFSQTIYVKVEDLANPICYSETSFDLIVNPLPQINLDDAYIICDLTPSLTLSTSSGYYYYEWYFEDGTILSTTSNATIEDEGDYTLIVTQLENDIECEKSFTFSLTRSILPAISEVKYGELGNNFIEIIATGDGDFEYSIDGTNYQDNNYFSNISGGTYTAYVRDKSGCGEDSTEVTIIDYPKFFTPNSDGNNDYWHIKGIDKFQNSEILIFNRYGKLLVKLSSNDFGWDGFYDGKKMASNDYWFNAYLGNGTVFSGHFTLKH